MMDGAGNGGDTLGRDKPSAGGGQRERAASDNGGLAPGAGLRGRILVFRMTCRQSSAALGEEQHWAGRQSRDQTEEIKWVWDTKYRHWLHHQERSNYSSGTQL